MSISTAGDLIALALKDSGVTGAGQTPLAEDSNDALTRLNMMLSQWNRRRWVIYHLVDSYLPATGALAYTVGIGGNFNIPRPAKIASAFMRMTPGPNGQPSSASVDYNLDIIEAREDWNKIQAKGINSFSKYCFYDAAFPLGNLYFWPVPPNIYELHISTLDQLAQFMALNQQINLPPEYYAALFYNLQRVLRMAYRLPPDEDINGEARATLATIRNANTQIPRLSMPAELRSRGRYNIFSDQG